MDKNSKFIMEARVQRTMESLAKNNMDAYYVETEKEALEKISELMPIGSTVGIGGSMTLFEIGAIDYLKNGNYKLLDRYKEGLTPAELKDIFKQSLLADVYLTSSNAITEAGELYNVDGNGNRVAAMLFGPDKVIVVVGINKIAKDINQAMLRVKEMAAPANNVRLNKTNPCTKIGYCTDCKTEGRICNEYTVIKRQGGKGRIHVIIVNKELGY